MNTRTLTLFIILIAIQTISAQFKIGDLIGTWESFETKSDLSNEIPITEPIGSKHKRKPIKIILKFNQGDKMDITQAGVPYKAKYKLKDSILTIGNRKYIISKFTQNLLVLKDFDNLFPKETHYRRSDRKIKTIKEYEYVEKRYSNGKLKIKGTLHNGFEEGLWTEWYENGQKKSERKFLNGIPIGIWKEWNKKGRLIKSRRMN